MLELFANPGYVAAGAALISAPIIIHLINRMRFKRLRWAAMEFLLKSQKRNRRRLIIEQLLLLALRCLLVAMVTMLVARFAGFSFGAGQGQDQLHIVLLDDTLSMNDQWKEGDSQRDCFQVAKNDFILDRIAKSLAQSNRNDRLVLLPLSRIVIDRNYQPRTYSRLNDKNKMDEFKSDLERLEPSKLHIDLMPGIKKVQELVANNPESRITLYLVSDFRQSDWSTAGGEAVQKALLQLAKSAGVEIRVQDTVSPYRLVGQGGIPVSHDNIGIVDLRASTRVAGKGMPVTFTATVANYSAREAQVNVAVFDDASGEERHEVDFNPPMPLKVPAGSTVHTSFELRFNPQIKATETYFGQISARLESAQRGKLENDGLVEDNVRHAAIEIRNKVPVLVIDGEGARGRAENQDSFFIRNAIASVPGASYEVVYGDELGGGAAAKALERPNLLQYPTIFILNVRELAPKQLANLENYVREGGGVAFFLGPLVSADYYNKQLYKKGKGVFPVPLRETYYPPPNEDMRHQEYTDDYQVLLRDDSYPNIETFPIFGPVLKDGSFRKYLKDLPVKRYFQVPRSEWRPEKGQVEELATLPNEQPILAYQAAALDILKKLDTIVKGTEEYEPFQRGIDRHRKIIEGLVGPTSEKKAFHLAAAFEFLLQDQGKEKDRADYPNLTEFWTNSDPKVRSLRDDIVKLAEQVKYGDPFIVLRQLGKGKVVAVMTTAGKEWNDWGGGSEASLLYQPFIWETQNYLSSQAADSYLTVGTPVQIAVDAEQYKKPGRQLKMVRHFKKAIQGKPAQEILDSEQFGDQKQGELAFSFDRNLEPGLYVSQLIFEGEKTPLAAWGHVFNVDTPREGKLLRVNSEDLDKLNRDSEGKIKIESPQAADDDAAGRLNDMSESPWFFLVFLGVLVAEQALAVHLSFHLRQGEGEVPATVPRAPARAA
jgi:hypothetical protein